MQSTGWLQLALYVAALAVITKPMGLYLMQVLDAKGGPGSTPCSVRSNVSPTVSWACARIRSRTGGNIPGPCCCSAW